MNRTPVVDGNSADLLHEHALVIAVVDGPILRIREGNPKRPKVVGLARIN